VTQIRSQIQELPSGKFKVTDEEGTVKIVDTAYEAEKWLWQNNEGVLPKDKKYEKGALHAWSPQDDFCFQIEYRTDQELEDWLLLHPDFVLKYGIPIANIDTQEVREIVLRTSSWQTVQNKGIGFIGSGSVDLKHINKYYAAGMVTGWTGVYDTYVSRWASLTHRNDWTAGWWWCTCEWGQWCNSGHRPHDGPDSWGSVKVNNRLCSHAFALYTLLTKYRKKNDPDF
jgi:hypothetical protein